MINPIGSMAPKNRMAMITGLTTRYIKSPSFSHARLAKFRDGGRHSVSPAKIAAMHNQSGACDEPLYRPKPPISANTAAIVNPKLRSLGPAMISSCSDSNSCIGVSSRLMGGVDPTVLLADSSLRQPYL